VMKEEAGNERRTNTSGRERERSELIRKFHCLFLFSSSLSSCLCEPAAISPFAHRTVIWIGNNLKGAKTASVGFQFDSLSGIPSVRSCRLFATVSTHSRSPHGQRTHAKRQTGRQKKKGEPKIKVWRREWATFHCGRMRSLSSTHSLPKYVSPLSLSLSLSLSLITLEKKRDRERAFFY
jgi:hypothetical protein